MHNTKINWLLKKAPKPTVHKYLFQMMNNLWSSPLPLNKFSVLIACYQLHSPAYLHGVARASRVTADPRKSMLPLPTLHTEHIPTKKLCQLFISLSLIDLMRIIYKSYWNQSNVTPLWHHPLVEQPDGFCEVCWAYCFLFATKAIKLPLCNLIFGSVGWSVLS